MRIELRGLVLGLALLAGAGSPAVAGGDHYGGDVILKSPKRGYPSAAVPVPAPIPVPVDRTPWYVRIDGGVGRGIHSSQDVDGAIYGRDDAPGTTGPVAFGMSSSWFNDDFPTYLSVGAGVGYRWNSVLRADLTLEDGAKGAVKGNGTYSYVMHGYDLSAHPPTYGPANPTDGTTVHGRVVDQTKVNHTLLLVNGYMDLPGHSFRGFKPYVGAGLGVAHNAVRREQIGSEYECAATTDPLCAVKASRTGFSGSSRDNAVSLAAALMAGVTVGLTESISLDMNYRLLYINGFGADLEVNGAKTELAIDDVIQHQLRAGLRFEIH